MNTCECGKCHRVIYANGVDDVSYYATGKCKSCAIEEKAEEAKRRAAPAKKDAK